MGEISGVQYYHYPGEEGLNSVLKDKRIWTGREGITSSLEDLTKHLCNICHSARMYRLSFEP